MTSTTIAIIPIAEIRIVNPRTRNRITFQSIKANIASIGLKKPITVHQRGLENDGTRYDLVCGQGRLESVRDLGETMIAAIINDAPEDERYLTQQQRALVRRSTIITERLAVITTSVHRLLADEHFVTLLRAEGLRNLPAFLTATDPTSDGTTCQ